MYSVCQPDRLSGIPAFLRRLNKWGSINFLKDKLFRYPWPIRGISYTLFLCSILREYVYYADDLLPPNMHLFARSGIFPDSILYYSRKAEIFTSFVYDFSFQTDTFLIIFPKLPLIQKAFRYSVNTSPSFAMYFSPCLCKLSYVTWLCNRPLLGADASTSGKHWESCHVSGYDMHAICRYTL